MTKPRYDEEENISRHAAVSASDCLEMQEKYGWTLERIEELPPTPNQIFEVDCVFEGKTEFPRSYHDPEREEAE